MNKLVMTSVDGYDNGDRRQLVKEKKVAWECLHEFVSIGERRRIR